MCKRQLPNILIMDNFDLRKYLAENKLLKENIDDLFGEYVAQWSQGNYDYDFADLKSGSVKGSLVDDFTLGPDEYDDDEYVRDYKIMRDYLLKNRSYKLSQDEKEGLSQFPVQFTLDDDGETIKADIYYSPEYLAMVDADLDEGRLLKEAEEPTGFLFRFSKEDAMNKAMAVLDQKGIGYNELGVHLVFHDKFGPATEEEVSEILRGEDILDWVIGEWKGDIYLKSEEEIKNM